MTNITNLSDQAAQVAAIPNATPEQHAIARAALIRDGRTEFLHYFFGGDAA